MRHLTTIILLLLIGCSESRELSEKGTDSKKYVKEIIVPFLASLDPQVYLAHVCPQVAEKHTDEALIDSVSSFRNDTGLLNTDKPVLLSDTNAVYWALDSAKTVIASTYFLAGEFTSGNKELVIGLIEDNSRWCIMGLSEKTD